MSAAYIKIEIPKVLWTKFIVVLFAICIGFKKKKTLMSTIYNFQSKVNK